MKKYLLLLLALSFTTSAFSITLQPKIMEAYKAQNYFLLKQYLKTEKLEDQERLFISAMVSNAFCGNDQSIQEIKKYVATYPNEYSDSLYIGLLQVQLDNYVKLSDYSSAAEINRLIIEKAHETLKKDELTELKNSERIWTALSGSGKQKVITTANEPIAFSRDIANLINIEVKCDTVVQDAIFDTGANLSVIVESLAQKIGLKIVGDSIKVKTVTGLEIYGKVAVAPQIQIGGIIVKNAVFLVFPDEALSFGGAYQIKMVIGFPIIKGLGQIEFDLKDQVIRLTNNEFDIESNMFLDGLMPIINVHFENESLLFTFDSGAKATVFYDSFTNILKKHPEYKFIADSVQMGGAGGIMTKQVYRLDSLNVKVLDKEIALGKCFIMKESIKELEENRQGNLGQDVISSGKGFVMDFNKMIFKILD